ncbi:MAG TPA: aminotransferase class III-fold pyridoxal phosphate-dependent enzyme, partial [Leucothrix mucor]|nr:aminotransferase class III-fold pyridoxal phosphate-dependent enzyme [Leucothrix mucor]
MNDIKDIWTFEQHESAARSYCRRFKSVFSSAVGSVMTDINGREYIDFLAACGALNYGHNDADMSKALIEHISSNGLSASLDLFTDSKAKFLHSFHQLILKPRQLDYRIQFTGPTGTNAVEAAMKLARKITGRNNIISFTNGFHGVSLGALSATGNKYHRMGGDMLSGITHMPFDSYMGEQVDTAEYLEKLLTDPSSGVEAPAAILLETVQGEGGLNVASKQWLQRIAEIAKQQGS